MEWNHPQQNAFKLLKELFTSYPVLRNPDPAKRYVLDHRRVADEKCMCELPSSGHVYHELHAPQHIAMRRSKT